MSVRNIAETVTALIVRDDTKVARQVANLVMPETDRLGPAVHQDDGRRVSRSEQLDVQASPVVRADRTRFAAREVARLLPQRIGVDGAKVAAPLDLERRHPRSGEQRDQRGPSHVC